MAHKYDQFGDFFHEIPEPEIFILPDGRGISSECRINSLGLTYSVEVIPRQPMIELLMDVDPSYRVPDAIALGFSVIEHPGVRGRATVYTEHTVIQPEVHLVQINADSLPPVKQLAA